MEEQDKLERMGIEVPEDARERVSQEEFERRRRLLNDLISERSGLREEQDVDEDYIPENEEDVLSAGESDVEEDDEEEDLEDMPTERMREAANRYMRTVGYNLTWEGTDRPSYWTTNLNDRNVWTIHQSSTNFAELFSSEDLDAFCITIRDFIVNRVKDIVMKDIQENIESGGDGIIVESTTTKVYNFLFVLVRSNIISNVQLEVEDDVEPGQKLDVYFTDAKGERERLSLMFPSRIRW